MPEPTFINDRYVRTAEMLAMIRTVLWRMLVATGAVAVLGTIVGYLIADLAGVWGSLLAAGIGLFFTGTTVVLIYLVVGRGPELLQIVLLGGWIVKMGVVFVLLLWLRQLDFYHRGVFVGAIAVLAVALLIVELVTVVNARIPVVDPRLRPDADPDPEDEDDPIEPSDSDMGNTSVRPAGTVSEDQAEGPTQGPNRGHNGSPDQVG